MITDERHHETTFGKVVRWHRREAGMTQAELAERMAQAGYPWHTSTVSKTESGKRDATVSELFELARIFSVPPAALVSPDTHALEQLQALVTEIEADLQAYRGRALELRGLIGEHA